MRDLVFFTVTRRDGTSVRINARNIVAYCADGDDGTFIHTTNGGYYVKEAPEEIDNFLNRHSE